MNGAVPRDRPPRVLVGAALLLMLLLGGGVYSLTRYSHATQWTRHTDETRLAMTRLMSTLADAETGVRGYVVAGDTTFLDTYDRALATWRAGLAVVNDLTADNAEQQARLVTLQTSVEERLRLLARTRALYDEGARADALTPTMRDGKRTMDLIRVEIAVLLAEEERLDRLHEADSDRRYIWTLVLLIGGGFAFLVVIATMIVQRRTAEARRREAAEVARAYELFRIVLQGVDMGVTVQEPNGNLVYANQTAALVLGFDDPKTLLETPVSELMKSFEIFDFDGLPFPMDQLPSRAALRGEEPPEVALRFRAKGSRSERWSLVRAVPARDDAGQVIYAINFFREVTEKTRQEAQRGFLLRAVDELNSSLDYEQTLASLARMAVPRLADWCSVDIADGGKVKRLAVTHVDPAKLGFVEELERKYPSNPDAPSGVPQILRTGKSEMMSEIPRDLIRAAAVDAAHLALIDELELRSYIGVPLKVQGKPIGVLSFVMAESGRLYTKQDLEFAEALADRASLAIANARLFKELENANAVVREQLAAENERRTDAEATARFADTFVGILGHDLRNPLNAILMAAQLLKKKSPGDTRTLDRIESSGRRMASMVAQLLDLARSRLAGGITVEPSHTDLGSIVTSVVDELRLVHPAREIRWEPSEMWGGWDRDRIGQVISNLLGNAIEHGDPVRPTTIVVSMSEGTARITVHSEGPPIQSDLLPVLFDPYRRTSARGERSKGLGLGLFITQQIVLAHGGSIDVRSTAEDGTTFTINLPSLQVSQLNEATA